MSTEVKKFGRSLAELAKQSGYPVQGEIVDVRTNFRLFLRASETEGAYNSEDKGVSYLLALTVDPENDKHQVIVDVRELRASRLQLFSELQSDDGIRVVDAKLEEDIARLVFLYAKELPETHQLQLRPIWAPYEESLKSMVPGVDKVR